MGVHKGLVAAVIGMAVLIVAGIIAVAVGLIVKSRQADFSGLITTTPAPASGPATPAPAITTAAPSAFGDITLQLAPGESIAASHATSDRAILRIRGADGMERLIVLDPKTGAMTGRVLIKPAP